MTRRALSGAVVDVGLMCICILLGMTLMAPEVRGGICESSSTHIGMPPGCDECGFAEPTNTYIGIGEADGTFCCCTWNIDWYGVWNEGECRTCALDDNFFCAPDAHCNIMTSPSARPCPDCEEGRHDK